MTKPFAKRTHPFVRYLFALTMTVMAYFLYAHTVVPVLEVEVRQLAVASRNFDDREIPLDNKQEYAHLFLAGDWELKPCKTLETAQGKILFDDYLPREDGTWDVFPFTMVLNSRSENTDSEGRSSEPTPPFVLRSKQGARLTFDRPFSLGTGKQSGKLEKAQLIGDVEFYRIPSSPTRNDGIRIVTTNVQLTESRVFTLDDVSFKFGQNKGQGRNLSIDLSHKSPPNAVTADLSKIDGIRRIRLATINHIDLLPKRREPNGKAVATPLSPQTGPLRITANGKFEFDLETSQAEFQHRVLVSKLDNSGDHLACQRLRLQFKSNAQAGVVRLGTPSASSFDLQVIEAEGIPAVLDIQSQNSKITGEFLRYDLANSKVFARSSKQVEVDKGLSKFVGQEVVYPADSGQNARRNPIDGAGLLVPNQPTR